MLFFVVTLTMANDAVNEKISMGKWTRKQLDATLSESAKIDDAGKRIEFLSEDFLKTPYREHTLIGDLETPEVFVINLKEVDCFTFIDYVEAMRLSRTFEEFKANLKRVRYVSGKVAFENRNHFFIDWRESNPDLVQDVTVQVSGGKFKKSKKTLNVRRDGSFFLIGIESKQREISYIPSASIDNAVIRNLKTGDYVGIYSRRQGLDVSHVGIIIKRDKDVYFRHASSTGYRKVVDQDFKKYISDKPGIVVLRPRS